MPDNPVERLQQLTGGFLAARCMHVAAELAVADALGDDAMEVSALAAAVGCDADALQRILRPLAAVGIFRSDHGSVAHTEISRLLRSDHPASFRPYVRLMGMPVLWRAAERLEHSVRTGEPSLPQVLPDGLWAHLEREPEEARIFDAAMAAKASAHIPAVIRAYDFSSVRVLADIGGGRGHLLHAILDAHVQARGVLFDLPHVIEAARHSMASPRLTFQAGDFFRDDLPAADGYLLMEVLHDWSDAQADLILQAIRRAAPAGARLLVIETVPPPSPEPTWANMLDILMLLLFAGKQRTRDEYDALLRQARFDLTAETDTGVGITVFEAIAV